MPPKNSIRILVKTDQDIFAKGLANGDFTGTACGPTNQCQACGAGCVEAACLPSAEGKFLMKFFDRPFHIVHII